MDSVVVAAQVYAWGAAISFFIAALIWGLSRLIREEPEPAPPPADPSYPRTTE